MEEWEKTQVQLIPVSLEFLEMSLKQTFFLTNLSIFIKETLMNPENYASMIFLYIEV